MIIDYEYAGLVERSWDLANYYIEVMLSNGEYDCYPWVELFEENCMQQSELEFLIEEYVNAVHEFDTEQILDKDRLLEEVRNMAIAINYYWGAWAMVSVDLDEVNEDNLYFPAAKHRLRMISKLKHTIQ